ncbi:MAG TPA: hypothetical protein VNR36_03805 [Pseudolysinimonas sp.]|nr:hypothetical protein [Pseudolysinimonas sp.]
MRAPRLVAAAICAVLLAGCVPGNDGPAPDPVTDAPVGPVAPAAGALTLASVAGIVSADDITLSTTFTPGDAASTSGDDLASENDYWIAVEGSPQRCAPVVSAPYLVSGHDTGDRLDDPTALLGTLTETDENRYGVIQVYARQFDDDATAQAFLAELTASVEGCEGYTLSEDGVVNFAASDLRIAALDDLPPGVAGARYAETVSSSSSTGVTTSFLQRDGVVISIYAEVTTSSTLSAATADELTATIASRLAVL